MLPEIVKGMMMRISISIPNYLTKVINWSAKFSDVSWNLFTK